MKSGPPLRQKNFNSSLKSIEVMLCSKYKVLYLLKKEKMNPLQKGIAMKIIHALLVACALTISSITAVLHFGPMHGAAFYKEGIYYISPELMNGIRLARNKCTVTITNTEGQIISPEHVRPYNTTPQHENAYLFVSWCNR